MKMKFKYIFIATAWVVYWATGRSVAGSMLLVFSGAYMLVDILINTWDRK